MSSFQRKKRSTEKSAKSKALAIEAALEELGIDKDRADELVDIEVLDIGSKGFFGIGARDARVRVTVKNGNADDGANPEAPKKAKEQHAAAEKQEARTETKNEAKKPAVLSDADPADEAKKFLADIFGAMGIAVDIKAELEGDTVKIDLSGSNMGIVIGKRGDTLDSLQYLTSLVVNQRHEEYIKVSIDTENYREKRSEALLALSNRLAEKVVKTGKKYTLEPMNPYERRIIHSNLQNHDGVTTFSVGTEPYRKVVIAPKGGRPYKGGYKKKGARPKKQQHPQKHTEERKEVSRPATYKADYKPPQHKAEYKSFEDYLAAQGEEK